MPVTGSSTGCPARWNRFWFGFRLSDVHLAVFRVLFFGVLAVDAWLQVEHAPRYAAGDFNVPNLPGLDHILPMPSRSLMLVAFVVEAYLAALMAAGRLSRRWVAALAVLFGYTYLISQLDSYQHHFMVLLILFALSFASWRPAERSGRELGDWPIRLVLVTMSLVYVWAVVAKSEAMWLEGRTLATQIHSDWARHLIERLFAGGADPMKAWSRAAQMVMVVEGSLAVAIHVRFLRWPAFVAGAGFHVAIEAAGFQIGLFSYFMVALYLLVLPVDDVARWLRHLAPAGLLARPAGAARTTKAGNGKESRSAGASAGGVWHLPAALALVAVSSVVLGLVLPFDLAAVIAIVLAILGALAVVTARAHAGRIAASHLAACVALVALVHVTDSVRDFYRFAGGSARRLGNDDEARAAYERLVEEAPDYARGYDSLGRLIIASDPDRALELFETAERLSPSDARGFLGEAEVHNRAGRGEDAQRAARIVLALEPDNKRAAAILRYWAAHR